MLYFTKYISRFITSRVVFHEQKTCSIWKKNQAEMISVYVISSFLLFTVCWRFVKFLIREWKFRQHVLSTKILIVQELALLNLFLLLRLKDIPHLLHLRIRPKIATERVFGEHQYIIVALKQYSFVPVLCGLWLFSF